MRWLPAGIWSYYLDLIVHWAISSLRSTRQFWNNSNSNDLQPRVNPTILKQQLTVNAMISTHSQPSDLESTINRTVSTNSERNYLNRQTIQPSWIYSQPFNLEPTVNSTIFEQNAVQQSPTDSPLSKLEPTVCPEISNRQSIQLSQIEIQSSDLQTKSQHSDVGMSVNPPISNQKPAQQFCTESQPSDLEPTVSSTISNRQWT